MNNILLSIIIPVYNVELYINECLDKFINDYKDGIELVLVDDGSKDKSGVICDEYAKKYSFIKVIHKKNGGLSSARNEGLRKASGKYVWFFDSDDYVSDNCLGEIINKINNDVDVLVGNYQCFYPDGKIEVNKDFLETDVNQVEFYKALQQKGCISYMAVRYILKREILIANNLYFTEGIYHEDEEWTPRMALKIKTYDVIEPVIYNYRVGQSNSIMGMVNEKKLLDKLKIADSFYDLSKKLSDSPEKSEFINSRLEFIFIAAINELCIYKKESRKKLKEEIKSRIYLLNNIQTNKSKMVKLSMKCIGIENTSYLLRLRLKLTE